MFSEWAQACGWALLIILMIVVNLIPDAIGKIVEMWRFFRGDRLE
jgi:hypothetical protein